MSLLKDFKPRLYQETILSTTALKNTLVVLPTGMGKTAIALMLAAQRLRNYPNSKIVILAPTRPLAEQHMISFQKHLDIEEMVLFTGQVSPDKRQEMFKNAKIIFSTPQGLENDVISNKINLKDVSLMVFDEAHRASGEYSYVWIASQYHKKASHEKILALTASPGDNLEKIQEVCQNLYIEEIEIRTEEDSDVKPYIQDVKLNFVTVKFPEGFKEVKDWLEKCFKEKIKEVQQTGLLPPTNYDNYSKKDILSLQAQLHGQLASGEKDFEAMKAVSILAQALKAYHAMELIETQGVVALHHYLSKLIHESKTTKVKATINLVKDTNFRMAWLKTENLMEDKTQHPKLIKLHEIVKEKIQKNPKHKLIIFTQFRDSGTMIKDELEKIEGVKPELFVGQAKKSGTGLSQKKQVEMLNKFEHSEFNVLIATSVAEEGIDIPKVDTVMFYEPIPSAIRHIQRRGRTGRTEKGEIIILSTQKTRDEAYRWSAHHKEKRMYSTLQKLRKGFTLKDKKPEQKTLDTSQNNSIKITADYREKGSKVIKELINQGFQIELQQLDVGDFVISSKVAVEYKTVPDFVNSIIDGRLLEQLKKMKSIFVRPIIIIEGTEDMYSVRNVHPNSIRGMLSSITVGYGIPILQTKNNKDTASMLATISRNESKVDESYSIHFNKPKTKKEQQEYIVSALPDIGPNLAKSMLEKFGTVRKVMNASQEQLKDIEKLGEKKSEKISKILDTKYQ